MNERIRQLAGQALDKAVPYTWTRLDYDEIQKLQEYFAELLFNEIANTAVVSDGMFNGNERRLSVELRLGDMVKKISIFGLAKRKNKCYT